MNSATNTAPLFRKVIFIARKRGSTTLYDVIVWRRIFAVFCPGDIVARAFDWRELRDGMPDDWEDYGSKTKTR